MELPVPGTMMVSTKTDQPLNADTRNTAATDQKAKPAFVTTSSLATLPLLSSISAGVWKVIASSTSATWADSRWVPAVICILFGAYLIIKSLEDSSDGKLSEKYGAVLIGAANTLFLWAAVIGIDVSLDVAGAVDATGAAPTN